MPTIDTNIIHIICTVAYIVTNLVSAAFCRDHMCHPFDRQPSRYYPARKQACIGMPLSLSLMPYVLWPDSPEVWTWVRIYTGAGIPLIWAMVYVGFRPFLKEAHQYDMDHYSNEDQFRLTFYRQILRMIVLYNLAVVIAAAVGDRWLMDAALIFTALYTVRIFKIALHPYGFPERESKVVSLMAEEMDSLEAAPADAEPSTDANARDGDALDADIRSQRLYDDSDVTLDDVAQRLGTDSSEVKAMLRQRDTTFYYYINNLRTEDKLRQWEVTNGYANTSLTIDLLARQMGTSAGFMKNFFRHHLHTTFSAWLTDVRIRQAKHLLIDQPGMSVLQIADAVGYDSPSGFSHRFSDIVGISPTQWRDNHTTDGMS